MKQALTTVLLFLLIATSLPAQAQPNSRDFYVPGDNGAQLFVREISQPSPGPSQPSGRSPRHNPLLLIHGGFGGLASFDLDVPHGSFAKDLASHGFKVYIMDIRGWEQSSLPNDSNNTSVTRIEASKDIDAVINHILKQDKVKKVNLFGWATGGHWASYYTTLHNDKVDRLITLNSLYGVSAPWSLTNAFRDPDDSTRYNKGLGKFRRSTRESLAKALDNSIPSPKKYLWRDSIISATCINTVVSFSKDSTLTTPGDFREESFYMAGGRQYWNARDIHVPVLLIRGALDFWSRPEDLQAYYHDLAKSPQGKAVTIEAGTHFIFLDRPEKGRDELIREMVKFIRP